MVGYIILALIGLFLAVVLIRAACFKPKKQAAADCGPVEFDKDASVEALAQLVRCKTVSYNDPGLEEDGEFEKLIGLLPKLYPHVFAVCELTRLPDRALLFHWILLLDMLLQSGGIVLRQFI